MNEQLKQAITLMQQGKEEGFNAVYSATYNHVYFRAKQTMKHEQDAEDLVQTVYTEAYRSISSLQSPDALFGWLDTITYNQGMKMFRKKKDVLLTEESEGMFEELESNDISSMPEPTMDEKETGNIIKELIGELPEAQKASVTAYYFDGFSVGKIAEMMECTEGTVKSRLNYARKYLKERILQKEKKEGYALHAVGLPVLWYALWKLSQQTKMTAYAAETVYKKSCGKLGLTTTALQAAPALAEAGAGTAQVMPSWMSALADAGFASGAAVASNSGAATGAQAASVFNTSTTSGTGAASSGAAGAGASTTGVSGAGAATATTGAFSVKAIIAAVAAVVVVSVGAAVVMPRVLNPQSDDTQQARDGSSQDEDENADMGDSVNDADDNSDDADTNSSNNIDTKENDDVVLTPVRFDDTTDEWIAESVAEMWNGEDMDYETLRSSLAEDSTQMSRYIYNLWQMRLRYQGTSAETLLAGEADYITAPDERTLWGVEMDKSHVSEILSELFDLDYDFNLLPKEPDNQNWYGTMYKDGTLTAWNEIIHGFGIPYVDFIDYQDNNNGTDLLYGVYTVADYFEEAELQSTFAVRVKPADNSYGYTIVGIYSVDDGDLESGQSDDVELNDYAAAIEQYSDVLLMISFDMQRWETLCPLARGYREYCSYDAQPVPLQGPPLYTLYDIDDNGTEEMLVLLNYSGRYELSDVISVVNGEATNVICGGLRAKIYLQEDGLVVNKEGSATYDAFNVYRMQKNGEMKCIYSYERSLNPSAPGEMVYTDDKSLSEQRKRELTSIAWDDSPVPATLNPANSGVWKNLQ